MKKFNLLKRVTEEKFQLYVPDDAFYVQPLMFDDPGPDNPFYEKFNEHNIYLVFSGDRSRLLGVVEYEKN